MKNKTLLNIKAKQSQRSTNSDPRSNDHYAITTPNFIKFSPTKSARSTKRRAESTPKKKKKQNEKQNKKKKRKGEKKKV